MASIVKSCQYTVLLSIHVVLQTTELVHASRIDSAKVGADQYGPVQVTIIAQNRVSSMR